MPSGHVRWLNALLGLSLSGFIFLTASLSGLRGPGATAGLILWSLFCGWSLFAIFHFRQINPHRFLLFCALAFGTFWAIQFSPTALWLNGKPAPAGTDGAICHIALAGTLANVGSGFLRALFSGHFYHIYIPALAYLLFTLLLGMGWCSWSCGYGAWDELTSRLGAKSPRWPLPHPQGIWKYTNAGILLSVVLLALSRSEAVFCQWVCPFKFFEDILSADPWLRQLQIGASAAVGIGLAVVLPALTGRRTFCRYVCPFGAWQSFAGRVNPFRLQADHNRCSHCGLCQKVCPVQAVTLSLSGVVTVDTSCVRCGRCVDVCPNSALRISWRRHSDGGEGLFTPWRIYTLTAVLLAGIVGAPAWMISGARFWRFLFGG